MSFIINRPDGTNREISGYKESEVSEDLKAANTDKLGSGKLPSKVDLRDYMTDVEDQQATNSCVANAVAGAYEYLAKKVQEADGYNASRLFIYYNARDLEENPNGIVDDGTSIKLAIDGLMKYGVCSENTWEFDTDIVNDEPDDDSYSEGEWFVVEDVATVPVDLDAWKSVLAMGYPIMFGLRLYKSFDRHRRPGLVPKPTNSDRSRGSHGGHAMLAVGYSDKDEVFIVRNSWGKDWGDEGYCYIPYDYLINEEHYLGPNGWIIRQIEDIEIDEESWDVDDESIFPDIDSELWEMSDEDYDDFLEELGDYPLEYRLAILFVYAAGQDDEVSDEEWDEIVNYLSELFEKMGSEYEAEKVLEHVYKDWEDEEDEEDEEESLLYETIRIFGEYFSDETLQLIAEDLEAVIGEDDLSEEEEEFIDTLYEEWELEDDEDEDE